jgi:F-type H+-transporting ATPase subunit b
MPTAANAPDAEALAAGAGAHEASGAFPPFDASLFPHQVAWFAITFAALYFLMSRLALPKVAAVIERRAATIKTDLEAAAVQSEAAEHARQEAERAAAQARAEARKTIDDMRAAVVAELSAEQAKADEALAARIAAAERRIGAARTKAMAEIGPIAAELARDIVAKLAPRERARA